MFNILYICNYMLDDVIKKRNNYNIFSQPANNKINSIRRALKLNNCNITILSSGLVNGKTFKLYKQFRSTIDNELIYASIIDIPLINTLSSILFLYKLIKKLHKEKNIDYIIFYNYKPEAAMAAFLAKIFLGIKIILEYEDGYNFVSNISLFKRFIFNSVEKLVGKHIDGAILVTSKLKEMVNVRYTIVRGMTNEQIAKKSKNVQKNNEKPVLMYSGGLDEERGIKILLESLKFTNYDFKLLISGRGPLTNNVKNNKDKRVEYLGFLDYEKVQEYMIHSDILINPQLEKHDFGNVSFPSKIFEYISTGNIIISSNVSDMSEFVKDSFYIYRNDDPKELARKIEQAINDINSGKHVKYLKKIQDLKQENLPIYVGRRIIKELFLNER